MKHWNDQIIEEELRRVIGGTDRMPSASELRAAGMNDLVCAITKRGGLLLWADRLGVTRAFSDSDFGWRGEYSFVNLCGIFGLEAKRTEGVKAPWDVTVEGIVRVDVKNAAKAIYGGHPGWSYRIGKLPQADLIVLFQDDTQHFYVLPWTVCPTSNVTISEGGGKYAAYLDNWELIRRMVKSRRLELPLAS